MGTLGPHFPRLEGAAEGLAICARQAEVWRDLEEQRDPRDPSLVSPWSCFVSPNAA